MSATSVPFYSDRDSRRRRTLLVAFAVLVVGAANLLKAVHIDDALYLAIAKQIIARPFDPYGFTINWQHTPQPAYAVSISPPLLSYWHAFWMSIGFGDGAALHMMMWPWIALLGWSVVSLLARVSAHAGLATTGFLLSPAVLAGTNLMLDVPMTACLTTAIECCLRAIDRSFIKWLAFSSIAASAGVLIKYPALVFIPCAILIAVAFRSWRPILPALCCAAAFFAWQWWSRSLYGAGQVAQATSFLEKFQGEGGRKIVERLLQLFAIFGATLPLWIVAAVHARSRIVSSLAALSLCFIGWKLLEAGGEWRGSRWLLAAFMASSFLGAFTATEIVVTSLRPAWRELRLCLIGLTWAGGIVFMTVASAPFVAVRYLLPAMPALLLVCLAALQPKRGALSIFAVCSAAIGIAVAVADLRWAAFYPTTIQKVRSSHPNEEIHFAGHWGLQWYAEKAGMKAWDARDFDVSSGSLMLVPRNADPIPIHPAVRQRMKLLRSFTLPPGPFGVSILRPTPRGEIGLRYYGWEFPHLPFGFASEPAESIGLFQIE